MEMLTCVGPEADTHATRASPITNSDIRTRELLCARDDDLQLIKNKQTAESDPDCGGGPHIGAPGELLLY
jgi:hypothetical protein